MPDVDIRLLPNIWASQTVECIGLGMLYYFESITGFLDHPSVFHIQRSRVQTRRNQESLNG